MNQSAHSGETHATMHDAIRASLRRISHCSVFDFIVLDNGIGRELNIKVPNELRSVEVACVVVCQCFGDDVVILFCLLWFDICSAH